MAEALISKATLYNYFPSKDSLLLGIAEAEMEEARRLLDGSLRGESSAVEKLRQVLAVFVGNSLSCLPLCRKITYLNSCEDSDLFAARAGMVRMLRDLAEEGQGRGEFRRDVPPEEIADLAMGVYLTAQFQWGDLSGCSEELRARRLDRLFRLTMAGVRA